MLQSVRGPDASNNGNIYLTGQRNIRADPLTPSSAISEFPESPSNYGHTFFSQRLDDEPHPDFSTTGYPFKNPPSQPLKRRLIDDPSSSMLDLDEDVRFSTALSDAYGHDGEDEDDTKTLEEDDSESVARMSYLGPKMRFHSPAPWELEDEPVQEVDETESAGHSSFIGILIGGRTKGGQKTDYASSRTSNVGRPSAESSRSFLNPKRSFETSIPVSHPRGALYALAQESLSTSSLTRPHHPEGIRGKFTFGKLRSHSPNHDIPSSPYHSATRLPSNNHTPITALPPRPSYDTTSSTLDVQSSSECSIHYTERKQSLPFSDASTHPYANPDLVQSYPTSPSLKSSPHSTLQSQKTSAESNFDIAENLSSALLTKPIAKSALVPETPAGPPKKQVPHLQSRDISSPLHVQIPLSQETLGHQQGDGDVEPASPLPVGMNAISGWSERGMNHGFTLISLEEARAQRTRTVPIQPHTFDPSSDAISPTGTSFRHTALKAPTSFNGLTESSQPHIIHGSTAGATQPRMRSISTGVKAKNVLQSFVGPKQPDRRGSEGGVIFGQVSGKDIVGVPSAPGKNLKHKKSGFMRLFSSNGSGGDKEPYTPPPPLPISPGGLAVPRHNPKLSSHRIPVPSLSPSLLEAVARHDGSHLSGLSSNVDQTPVRLDFNDKRVPPPLLSINVGSSSSPTSAFSTGPASPGSLFPETSNRENTPQSAPPHISDFPALKLRPISTLFSGGLGAELDMAKFSLDEVEPKETRRDPMGRTEMERPRQHSLASSSLSSPPSSATSFADSQMSPATSSYASISGTALTTPTTGGLMSPIGLANGPWGRDYGAGTDGGLSLASYSTLSPRTTTSHVIVDSDASTTIKVLQEHLENTNKMWQDRVLDLENEISRLKAEVVEWKSRCTTGDNNGCCKACGKKDVEINGTHLPSRSQQQVRGGSGSGVMNRPRARTGGSSRFVNGQL